MIVMRMIMMCMIVMTMRMRMRFGRGIGAAFRIERRLDLDDAGAETLHHLLDDVIAADAQRLRHDLHRQMAIAEMPGDARRDAADRCSGFRAAARPRQRPRPCGRLPAPARRRRAAPRPPAGRAGIRARACRSSPCGGDGGRRKPSTTRVGRRLLEVMLPDDAGGADHVLTLRSASGPTTAAAPEC